MEYSWYKYGAKHYVQWKNDSPWKWWFTLFNKTFTFRVPRISKITFYTCSIHYIHHNMISIMSSCQKLKLSSVLGVVLNSLCPSYAIWHRGSWSTLLQAIACCLIHQVIAWTNADTRLLALITVQFHRKCAKCTGNNSSFKITSLKIICIC